LRARKQAGVRGLRICGIDNVLTAGAYPRCRSNHKTMRKTYLLNIDGKNRDRLLDAAKHDIRRYVKRERARALPEGVDFWDFDCKLGASETAAAVVHFAALMASIDALVKDGGDQFYVEVVTKHGHRQARPQTADAVSPSEGGQS
jgi:hypothetical protein